MLLKEEKRMDDRLKGHSSNGGRSGGREHPEVWLCVEGRRMVTGVAATVIDNDGPCPFTRRSSDVKTRMLVLARSFDAE